MTAHDLDLSRPFTTAQALAAGLTAPELRTKRFRRLGKGKYVSAARSPSALLAAEAALLGHPAQAIATHFTAARFYGMPVPVETCEHVGVLLPGQRRRRLGVRSHVVAPETRVLVVEGVRLADPVSTFVQLASRLPLVELVVVGDYVVRKGWCTPEQLVARCRASTEAHACEALAAASYVRAGVDSPMESRLRMLLVLAGLPEPEVNFVVRDEHGAVLRRYDLYYADVRVLVEYDGRQHADDAAQWNEDLARREELDEDGRRIIVVTAEGAYRDPERTLVRVRAALRGRGRRRLPAHFDPAWRRHFPTRTGPASRV